MSKKGGSAPAAPDPNAVSQAQTQSNEQTALFNFGLNNPNYNTPLGSLTYTQTGGGPKYDTDAYNKALAAWQANPGSSQAPDLKSWLISHPNQGTGDYLQLYGNGNASTASAMPKLSDFLISQNGPPQVTANVQLSPVQQQLFDLQNQQSLGLANLANALQGNVSDALKQPIATSGDINQLSKNASDAFYNSEAAYLDPQWAKQEEQLTSQLANKGIMPGSDAYNLARDEFNRNKTFAYQQAQQNAILQGPQNASQLFGLSTQARELPLNEFNALRSGSQAQMPQVPGTNPSQAAPTNVAQNIWNAYGAQQNAYNQQQAQQNATMGGLFGLGGNLGAAYLGSDAGSAALTNALAFLSDIRLKDNISYMGEEKGFSVYHFTYRHDPSRAVYRGVMAHDVLNTRPDAVLADGEYMAVDYGKIGIEFGRVH